MSLINFFDNRRFWGGKRNKFLSKIYFYPVCNRITDILANIILPIYFNCTKKNPRYSLNANNGRKDKIIVSLTSFPPRLPKLHLVIECILRQSIKPDEIILYLTEEQVGSIDNLPRKLLDLRERGLQIKLCPDKIRSHTKYFYAMKEHPEDIIITVDDDLFYRTDLIERHIKAHNKYPKAIIANWVKEILSTTDKYNEWPDGTEPKLSNRFLLLGVSSVLYPPQSLHEEVFNKNAIIEQCLTADDVWLSCMALLKETPIYFTKYKYNHLPIRIKNNETLLSINRERNQVCVDNLNKYYDKKLGVRPFIDLPNSHLNNTYNSIQ